MKYKHKPTIVDAVQYPNDNGYPAWFIDAILNVDIYTTGDYDLAVDTLEGTMVSNKGDYVIKSSNGEFWFCKPDIFDEIYEVISDD